MAKQVSRSDNPLRWLLLSQAFSPLLLNKILRLSDQRGFGQATYVDGSARDNVQTVFLQKDASNRTLKAFFDRIAFLAKHSSALFDIPCYPGKMKDVQVAKYMPGDHYGHHTDHDPSLQNLKYDRKLSIFGSLSDGGLIEVEGEVLNVGFCDAVVFPSTMSHAAPVQRHGARYSFVAWIPGPPWK